ncbi:MAG: hypothetical protein K5668_09520 [Lachnospiraceae bacterium]|nr:hypothetical protein [Lachnospiraceae bacterium]
MTDNKYPIDDITWNDLDLDIFFRNFDKTCSRNGGEYLYDMLRRPLISGEGIEELKERGRVSELFRKDKDLRDRYIKALSGDEEFKNDRFRTRLEGLFEAETDPDILHFLSLFAGVISLAFIFIYPPAGFVLFIIAAIFNVFSYFKRKNEIDCHIPLIRYLLREIREVRRLAVIDTPGLSEYRERLINAVTALKSLENGVFLILSGKNLTGGIMELPLDFIRIFLHPDLIKYNSIIRLVKKEKAAVKELFDVTGFLDSMISLSYFRDSLPYFTEPEFNEGRGITITKGYHPLLDNPVPYDIRDVSHMLLTGSNASGKSTFLKSAALNLILAETVYTVPAESMSTEPVEIFSSMSLRDNITEGDSLYVTEIKSVKRIVERKKAGVRIAVFLDEVLKGTNTVERIASLSVLLKNFSDCALCFAATHDTPLTEILQDIYDNYHFDEKVTEEGISFPYELKKGRSDSKDAIMLLSVMGFDKEITGEAFRLSDSFLKEGVWEKL